jgi:hypothetical protein
MLPTCKEVKEFHNDDRRQSTRMIQMGLGIVSLLFTPALAAFGRPHHVHWSHHRDHARKYAANPEEIARSRKEDHQMSRHAEETLSLVRE